MDSSPLRCLLTATFCLAYLAPTCSAQGKPLRTDAYGDPLPDGVVARLGTTRLVHIGEICSLAVSPDGKVVASGIYWINPPISVIVGRFGGEVTPATIRLWDAATGKRLHELTTPDAPVTPLVFDPDSATLFAGCGKFVCAWDVKTGKRLWQSEVNAAKEFHEGHAVAALVLAKGTLLSVHEGAVFGEPNGARIRHPQKLLCRWDVKTGALLKLPAALAATMDPSDHIGTLFHEVAVSPTGRHVTVGVSKANLFSTRGAVRWAYERRRLEIVDVQTGEVVRRMPGADAKLVFAPDGLTLAALDGANVHLLDVGSLKTRRMVAGLSSPIVETFFAEPKLLAARLVDESIRVWNIETAEPVEAHRVRKPGVFAGNDKIAASVVDNTVRLQHPATGKSVVPFEEHRGTPLIRYALHAPDTLISRDLRTLRFWDTRGWTGKAIALADHFADNQWDRASRHLDDDLAPEKGLYFKHTLKGQELRHFTKESLVSRLPERADLQGAFFSAAGNRLAIRTSVGVHFHDAATGRRLASAPRPEIKALDRRYVQLSSGGRLFAECEPNSSRIEILDVETGKEIRTLEPANKDSRCYIRRLHVSNDERMIVAEVFRSIDGGPEILGTQSTALVLWSLETGDELQSIVVEPFRAVIFLGPLGSSWLGACTLSPDQRTVALARHDSSTIELWDVASGTRRGELVGHEGVIADLVFSPDGRQLASSSEDTSILVWDVNRPLVPAKFVTSLDEKELAKHWETLAQLDAKKADVAIWSLVHAPKDAIGYLQKHFPIAIHPGQREVRALLNALDSDDFATRFRAAAKLEAQGGVIRDDLSEELNRHNTLEKQRRLQSLFEKANDAAKPYGTVRRTREWRVLEVLERIGADDGRQFLRKIADGAPNTPIANAARSALRRLDSGR